MGGAFAEARKVTTPNYDASSLPVKRIENYRRRVGVSFTLPCAQVVVVAVEVVIH